MHPNLLCRLGKQRYMDQVVDWAKTKINTCKTGDTVLGSAKIDGADGIVLASMNHSLSSNLLMGNRHAHV